MTVVVVAGAAALAAAGGERPGEPYRAVFDNAFGLTEGGDLKIAGVSAGQTTGFKVTHERPYKAVVEFEITEPGVGELREDARCEIRPQSLIGEYFVDCQPGTADEKLAEGGTIPVEQTSSTIPVDLVNNILRRPYRERLRLIIAELGTGLAGRPDDLAEVLRRAHPGLRETSRTLRILANQNRTIQKFIGDAQVVTAQLENRKADVSRWVDEAGETAAITATRREELQRNFQLLPGLPRRAAPVHGAAGNVADEQIPTLADLQAAAPDLDTFLARLGPFSHASRPAFRGLGTASDAGLKAFTRQPHRGRRAARARRATCPAWPSRCASSCETPRRPRARRRARPARQGHRAARARQDPHRGQRRLHRHGVALELLLLAGLSINGRDDVGHVLKIIGVEDSGLHALLRHRRGRGGDLRAVQPVPRPQPARDHHAGPAGRQPAGRGPGRHGRQEPPGAARAGRERRGRSRPPDAGSVPGASAHAAARGEARSSAALRPAGRARGPGRA